MFIRALNIDASSRKEQFLDELRFINGVWFRLNELVTVEKEKTLSRISRKNQQYTRLVSFEYLSSWEKGRTYQNEIIEQFPTPLAQLENSGQKMGKKPIFLHLFSRFFRG